MLIFEGTASLNSIQLMSLMSRVLTVSAVWAEADDPTHAARPINNRNLIIEASSCMSCNASCHASWVQPDGRPQAERAPDTQNTGSASFASITADAFSTSA